MRSLRLTSRYKGFPRQGDRGNPFSTYPELCTETVFLIGNGSSRKGFDLEKLRDYGTIVGCNALYRDFAPDVLVAIDSKMINEIKDSKYWENNICVVPANRSVGIPNSLLFKADKFNTSGCFAMQMISKGMKAKYCVMIGMDGYPGNVYDKTKNYATNTLQNFKGVLSYYEKVLVDPKIETIFVNVNKQDEWPDRGGKYKFVPFDIFENWLDNKSKFYSIESIIK